MLPATAVVVAVAFAAIEASKAACVAAKSAVKAATSVEVAAPDKAACKAATEASRPEMSVAGVAVLGNAFTADDNAATVPCSEVNPEDKELNPSIWLFNELI